MEFNKSKEIYNEAVKYIPGGVNSPVRAFKSVGMEPIFIERAKGAKIYDADSNEYTDYICSWGPLILGHSNDELLEGFVDILKKGTSYGVPTKIEVDVAKFICENYTQVEMVRMVNSGTEATMSALRTARAYTKRNKIVKFEGCYHGHSDSLLVKSGSGTITYNVPTSPGVPEDTIKDTLVCRYNDLESVINVFDEYKDQIAAGIVEPVAGNMGVVPAKKEFLEGLRKITKDNNSVLIFDEVITGFRLAFGGAKEVYGVEADMTCFGKIIGAGLPVGAYGGKREIMEMVSPLGPVYQAGTLSGNPLAMYMGYKNLLILKERKDDIYNHMERLAKKLESGFNKIIEELNLADKLCVSRINGMISLFFTNGPIVSYDSVKDCDTNMYGKFFRAMLERGFLLPPAQFEGFFLSYAHTDEDVDKTIEATKESIKEIYSIN
ncbi:MAG: glutamate-1-semialdehyde 2,1-aminomutase [Peptostreptococcaceae bacterium]|jgi:glutamate-1-semialdehyde 2,1-aminomutase|nr:glutamate-1-semialdehyde 2,1-aminomutase [Peptostreptococcaceae bacterium]